MSTAASRFPEVDVSWPVLGQGDRGEPVRSTQYLLRQRAFSVVVDGVFGPRTVARVRAFQASEKLTADGVVGRATWPRLIVEVARGSRGEAVRGVQSQLRGRGDSVVIDGRFGSSTEGAVRNYQTLQRLRVDGIVGPETWGSLVTTPVGAPVITITSPSDGLVTNQREQMLVGSVSVPATVTVNGEIVAPAPAIGFAHRVVLTEGTNVFDLRATSAARTVGGAVLRLTLDTARPLPPQADLIALALRAGLVGLVGAPHAAEPGVEVRATNVRTGESAAVATDAQGAFGLEVPASAGDVIVLVATDPAGNVSVATELGVPGPASIVINVTSPQDGLVTNRPEQTLVGRVGAPAQLTVNGENATVSAENAFAHRVRLLEGENIFELVATGSGGAVGRLIRRATLDTVNPQPPVAALISLTLRDGSVTVSGSAGCVEGGAEVRATNPRSGEAATARAEAAGGFAVVLAARTGDVLSLVAVDTVGNASAATELRVVDVPSDPVIVAPPVDSTVATDLASSTEFLYSGDNAIQQGVAPGTIESLRAAILRGRAVDQTGAPVAGVQVTILGHREYGTTLTRADGRFDLVVNGGRFYTLEYAKNGHLPAQRSLQVPWQDFALAPDVVLVRPATEVAPLDLDVPTGVQVARGAQVSDEDGQRRATLLAPPGIQGEMTLPDGTRQPLTSVGVRATEFTVGAAGAAAMPAELPAQSAYTYAVEYSVDEAAAVGATEVRFNKPLVHYVENFLGFPVGSKVPVGYYDRERGQWIASQDGRVIAILRRAAGRAELDIDGDGLADTGPALQALGIDDDEREQLAALYPDGQTLWRVPITHFTPWDCNFPWGPPPDARPPGQPDPETDVPPEDPCLR